MNIKVASIGHQLWRTARWLLIYGGGFFGFLMVAAWAEEEPIRWALAVIAAIATIVAIESRHSRKLIERQNVLLTRLLERDHP